MRHFCAQPDAPSSRDLVYATLWCTTSESPQLPPSHVVILAHLASAELPKPSSTSQAQSVKWFLSVTLHQVQLQLGMDWKLVFYFLAVYIFSKMSILLLNLLLDSLFFYVSPGQVWKSPLRASWIA